jgi:hypothetical protein
VADLAVRDVAADLANLEPIEMVQRLRRLLDRVAYRRVDPLRRRADDFDQLVRVLGHCALLPG